MVSVYTDNMVADIPLKRPQETFVDDPSLMKEAIARELKTVPDEFARDINRLHVFNGMAILEKTIELVMALQEDKKLFDDFRNQQLRHYGIQVPPPTEVSELDTVLDEQHEETPNADVDSQSSGSSSHEIVLEPEGFISTESLVQTTSLEKVQDPITTVSSERLRRELDYHASLKTRAQTDYLLRSFALVRTPPISIQDFLIRINKYSPSISVTVYIHSAYMLFKLALILDAVKFTPLNVHRLILGSIRCSTKVCEDIHQKQKNFAVVGGVALKELSRIEVSFLYLSNFNLVVSEQILNLFLSFNYASLKQFCQEMPVRAGHEVSV